MSLKELIIANYGISTYKKSSQLQDVMCKLAESKKLKKDDQKELTIKD